MKPSLSKILLNDYGAFMLAIGGPIALAITGYTAWSGFVPKRGMRGGQAVAADSSVYWCVGAAILTVVLLVFLFRRIVHIKHVLASGVRTSAKVTEIGFFKDRGRIEFEYSHDGQEYKTGTGIMKNKHTEAIAQNDIVEVALDPANYSRAYVVNLYCA